nr:unnamed protein product [Digitaria exilis]
MLGAEQVVHLWKEWGIQVLMLLSFTLQVELYILAELRRRIDSGLLRIFAWSAYQLADTVAIFVLGHLSVISRSPEHELMLLWAPFLLLHLGSQDNITAYAIEDNQLWLRHLQTFVSQVAAASYVLYESSILSNSRSLLRPVAILMFVVGVAKYGEREDVALGGKNLFKVAEMQLSLMHDVFYTKAEVMCTWRTSRSSKIARWMGVEDPWNTLVYSGSIRVSASVKQLVVNRVHQWRRAAKMGKVSPQALGHMIGSWGLAALTDHGGLHESLSWAIDVPLEEGILIWHVATNIYLSWYRKQVMAAGNQTDEQLGTQAEELSNYMLFLLSARPYMLSPLASRKAYVEMCYGLTGLGCSSVEELATALQNYGDTLNRGSSIKFTYTTIDIAMDDPLRHDKTLERGIKLGAELIANPVENKLSLVSQVWVEMLCYAGYNCSTYSHAKQLSKGGEFISIAALLVKYIICDINLPIISDHDKW